MRYQPKIGKDFPLAKDVIVAKTKHVMEVTRSTIAISVVGVCLFVLAITAISCAYRGEFQALQTLWAIMAAPLGWVLGHYFRGNGTNGQEDHARTVGIAGELDGAPAGAAREN